MGMERLFPSLKEVTADAPKTARPSPPNEMKELVD
jgi:hypothetical protein